MRLIPKLKFKVELSEALKGKALAYFDFVCNQLGDAKSIVRSKEYPDFGVKFIAEVKTDFQGRQFGTVKVIRSRGEEEVLSGFLFLHRWSAQDESENPAHVEDELSGFRSLILTDRTGFVKIIPKVPFHAGIDYSTSPEWLVSWVDRISTTNYIMTPDVIPLEDLTASSRFDDIGQWYKDGKKAGYRGNSFATKTLYVAKVGGNLLEIILNGTGWNWGYVNAAGTYYQYSTNYPDMLIKKVHISPKGTKMVMIVAIPSNGSPFGSTDTDFSDCWEAVVTYDITKNGTYSNPITLTETSRTEQYAMAAAVRIDSTFTDNIISTVNTGLGNPIPPATILIDGVAWNSTMPEIRYLSQQTVDAAGTVTITTKYKFIDYLTNPANVAVIEHEEIETYAHTQVHGSGETLITDAWYDKDDNLQLETVTDAVFTSRGNYSFTVNHPFLTSYTHECAFVLDGSLVDMSVANSTKTDTMSASGKLMMRNNSVVPNMVVQSYEITGQKTFTYATQFSNTPTMTYNADMDIVQSDELNKITFPAITSVNSTADNWRHKRYPFSLIEAGGGKLFNYAFEALSGNSPTVEFIQIKPYLHKSKPDSLNEGLLSDRYGNKLYWYLDGATQKYAAFTAKKDNNGKPFTAVTQEWADKIDNAIFEGDDIMGVI